MVITFRDDNAKQYMYVSVTQHSYFHTNKIRSTPIMWIFNDTFARSLSTLYLIVKE